MEEKRYYWLKLKRDFFKRHDIRVVESMPNGTEYVLFYLKLLCESIDHEGNLRFSEQIPYNAEMLSAITATNVDIVRSAVKVFTELGMMELLDDGTIYMNEVESLIGSQANNDNANRQRRFRERQKQNLLPDRYGDVTKSNESIEKETEKETEKEVVLGAKAPKKSTFTKPTLEEISDYAKERGYDLDAEKFFDYYEMVGWVVGKARKPMKSWKSAVNTWIRTEKEEKKAKMNVLDEWNAFHGVEGNDNDELRF